MEYQDHLITNKSTTQAFADITGTTMRVSDWLRDVLPTDQAFCHHNSFAMVLDCKDCVMVMGKLSVKDMGSVDHSWIELTIADKVFVLSANQVHIDDTIAVYTQESFYQNADIAIEKLAVITHPEAIAMLPDEKSLNLLQINQIVQKICSQVFGTHYQSTTNRQQKREQAKCKVKL